MDVKEAIKVGKELIQSWNVKFREGKYPETVIEERDKIIQGLQTLISHATNSQSPEREKVMRTLEQVKLPYFPARPERLCQGEIEVITSEILALVEGKE